MLGIDQLPLKKKKIKKWRDGVRLNKIFRLKTLLNNVVLEIYHKEFKRKYFLEINFSHLFGVELFVSALEWDQIKDVFWREKRCYLIKCFTLKPFFSGLFFFYCLCQHDKSIDLQLSRFFSWEYLLFLSLAPEKCC